MPEHVTLPEGAKIVPREILAGCNKGIYDKGTNTLFVSPEAYAAYMYCGKWTVDALVMDSTPKPFLMRGWTPRDPTNEQEKP
jgi:hypothetical protein